MRTLPKMVSINLFCIPAIHQSIDAILRRTASFVDFNLSFSHPFLWSSRVDLKTIHHATKWALNVSSLAVTEGCQMGWKILRKFFRELLSDLHISSLEKTHSQAFSLFDMIQNTLSKERDLSPWCCSKTNKQTKKQQWFNIAAA